MVYKYCIVVCINHGLGFMYEIMGSGIHQEIIPSISLLKDLINRR